ncbi:succinyl-diaminopimelate desuccinylase [Devosia sp.]|uniref:succinyl-diaminopimelate desuccinylase n=1 Tax=Devosia sp. TaxID=1871048 RepID=UPI003A8F609A
MTSETADDAVRLLQEMIRCASVTPEAAGVFDVLEAALTPLGFTCERLRFEGDGSYPVDNLFATRGTAGKHLLFAGHTDVVPPGDAASWTHPPFAAEIADGLMYGRGTTDMKAGVAAFVAALAAIPPEAGRISLAITNDEEADAVNGTDKLMQWAEAQGHRFDFCIVGEPSATARVGDSIKIGRRGSLNGRISVTGTQGHVAYPDKANNPLPVAAALLSSLSGKLDDGTEHFPPSNLEFTSVDVGNTTTNVIPAKVEMRFNIRHNDRWTPQGLIDAVNEVIANCDKRDCVVDFTTAGRPSPVFISEVGGGVEVLIETIARATGIAPELSTAGGTSDGRFIANYCPVVEFGTPGASMHKVDEHVRLEDLKALVGLYRSFITDYFA